MKPQKFSSQRLRKVKIVAGSILGILLVWLASTMLVKHIRAREISPEEFKHSLLNKKFASLNGKDRREALVYLTDRLNHLSLEGRRKIERDDDIREWFETLAQEERSFVIRETLPGQLELLREEFNKLTPEERKKAVDNAVKDIKNLSREEKEWVESLISSSEGKAIIETGLKSYYLDSSYPEKLELSPIITAVSDELEKISNR